MNSHLPLHARLVLFAMILSSYSQAHHQDPESGGPEAAARSSPTTARVISGRGDFRYEYLPGRLVLPDAVRMKHGHGLCHDSLGRIYFTFEPENVEAATRALVRFEPDGSGAVLLGSDNSLALGVPHGLSLHTEKDGRAVLYHANNDATIHKTTLDGQILWSQKWTAQMGNYKPTDAVAPPGTDRLVVADGYGSSIVHTLQSEDGIYAGRSWGGLGGAHGEFNCPHGIAFDPRRQLILVADRGNKRLEYFTVSGHYHSTIEAPEISAPCNADIQGDFLLVPNLDGSVAILDKNNQVISVIEVAKLLGDRGFRHPHDAIWLPDGDIVLCTWNPGRLAYWRRLR